MDRRVRDLKRMVEPHGWVVDGTTGSSHLRLRHKDGARWTAPCTPSDRRHHRNLLADLRRNIALVSQEPVLFNDTVAYNIAYGRPGASRAQQDMHIARQLQRCRMVTGGMVQHEGGVTVCAGCEH